MKNVAHLVKNDLYFAAPNTKSDFYFRKCGPYFMTFRKSPAVVHGLTVTLTLAFYYVHSFPL